MLIFTLRTKHKPETDDQSKYCKYNSCFTRKCFVSDSAELIDDLTSDRKSMQTLKWY